VPASIVRLIARTNTAWARFSGFHFMLQLGTKRLGAAGLAVVLLATVSPPVRADALSTEEEGGASESDEDGSWGDDEDGSWGDDEDGSWGDDEDGSWGDDEDDADSSDDSFWGPEGFPATFSGDTALIVEWRIDNKNGDNTDDNFGDAILRSNLRLDAGDTRMGLRVDGEAFVGEPAGVDRRTALRAERLFLELDRHLGENNQVRLSATLGDFYAQFGNGLVLSLRAIDQLGVDIAARGARVDVHLLDDRLTLTALAGVTNPVNIEIQRLRHTEDPNDRLGGARAAYTAGDVTVGFHGVGMREHDAFFEAQRRTTFSYGGTVDAYWAGTSFSFEVDRQQREIGSQQNSGWAAYGTSTTPLGRVTLMTEFKHYKGFEPLQGSLTTFQEGRYTYALPPTTERIDQEILDNTDITGGRLRADVITSEVDNNSAFANLGLYQNRRFNQWFAHAFGGMDRRWDGGGALLISGGYRREWMVDSGDLTRAIAHGELDLILPAREGLAFHLIAQHQSHVIELAGQRSFFHRGNSSLEVDWKTKWVALVGFDWNTEDKRPNVRRFFAFAVLRYRASDKLILQFLGGSQRGGIRCIAGACRDFPPFAGVRLDTTWRF